MSEYITSRQRKKLQRRAYAAANRSKLRANSKAWYEKNKQAIKEENEIERILHAKRFKLYQRKLRQSRPWCDFFYRASKRAARYGASFSITVVDAQAAWEKATQEEVSLKGRMFVRTEPARGWTQGNVKFVNRKEETQKFWQEYHVASGQGE